MERLKRQEGLTLAEVLVAVAIIAIALSPMMGVLASSRKSLEGASRRAEAAAVARSVMDTVMAKDFTTIVSQAETEYTDPVNLYEIPYKYTVTVTNRNLSDGSPYIKDIVVTVTWTEKGESHSVTIYSAVTMRWTGE
ncbi:MAG: type IV pilus modification PilV family protein [Bacillota bacterium]